MIGIANKPIDKIITSLIRKVPVKIWITIISGIISGFIAHGFIMSNAFFMNDSLVNWVPSDKSINTQVGRWLQYTVQSLITSLGVQPWLSNWIYIVITAIGSCLIVSIFDMRSRVCCALTGITAIVIPECGFCAVSSYMSVSFGIAYTLVIAALYASTKNRRAYLTGALMVCASLSIYQLSLFLLISLCAVYLIREALDTENDIKYLLSQIAGFIFVIGTGLILYGITAVISISALGEFIMYRGIDKSLANADIISGIILSLKYFTQYYYTEELTGFGAGWLYVAATIDVIACIVIIISSVSNKRIRIRKAIIIAVLAAVTPILINAFYVVTAGSTDENFPTNTSLYSSVAFPVLLIAIADKALRTNEIGVSGKKKKTLTAMGNTLCIIIAVICWKYCVAVNEAYTVHAIVTRQAYEASNRLAHDIQNTGGWKQGMTIRTYGNPDILISGKNPYEKSPKIRHVNDTDRYAIEICLTSLLETQGIDIGDTETFGKYMITDKEKDDRYEIIDRMPSYPEEGSIAVYGNELIIKFSGEYIKEINGLA